MAGSIFLRMAALFEALDGDADPVPIKLAMSLARPGFSPRCRLPLVDASAATRHAIEVMMAGMASGPTFGRAPPSSDTRPRGAREGRPAQAPGLSSLKTEAPT